MKYTEKSLFRGSAIVFLSLIIAASLSLLVTILIVRSLSVEEFGIYSIIISVQSVIILIGEFGIPKAFSKFISEHLVLDRSMSLSIAKTGLIVVLVLCSVSSLVYIGISGIIGNGVYHEPIIFILIPFSALVVISSGFFDSISGMIQGCQRFSFIASLWIASPIINLGAIAILIRYLGIEGIFLGFFFTQIIISIFAVWRLSKTNFSFLKASSMHRSPAVLRNFLSFSGMTLASGLVVLPTLWFGYTILTLTSNFQSVGYFAIAYGIYNIFLIVPSSIVTPLLPRLSEMSKGSRHGFDSTVIQAIRYTSTFIFPLVFAVGLFADSIINILYGSAYSPASIIVFLMVIAAYFYAISSMPLTALLSTGKMRLYLLLQIIWGLTFICMALILIPILGSIGLALAFVVSFGINLISSFIIASLVLKLRLIKVYPNVMLGIIVIFIGLLIDSNFALGLLGKMSILLIGSLIVLIPMRNEIVFILHAVRR